MVRSKDKYTVSVDFPLDMQDDIKTWAAHHGSINQAIVSAVREAVLAYKNEETTRVRVQRIDANVQELNERFKYLESLGWAQLNALEINLGEPTRAWVEGVMAR